MAAKQASAQCEPPRYDGAISTDVHTCRWADEALKRRSPGPVGASSLRAPGLGRTGWDRRSVGASGSGGQRVGRAAAGRSGETILAGISFLRHSNETLLKKEGFYGSLGAVQPRIRDAKGSTISFRTTRSSSCYVNAIASAESPANTSDIPVVSNRTYHTHSTNQAPGGGSN